MKQCFINSTIFNLTVIFLSLVLGICMLHTAYENTGKLLLAVSIYQATYVIFLRFYKKQHFKKWIALNFTILYVFYSLIFITAMLASEKNTWLTIVFAEFFVFLQVYLYFKFRNRNNIDKSFRVIKKWGVVRFCFRMFFIGITVVLIASIVLEIQSLGNVLDPYYFIVLIVFLVDVLISHLNHTIQLKNEQTKAELILLRSQLNPHFFFNTLNNLYALTIKNSKQAPEVILKLSDMMRYTIYEGEKNSVSLKEEIMYLENYIELHKIRYKKDVKIEFNNTVHQNLTVAPLLFINLLENAFKHGIDMVLKNPFIKIDLNNDANFIYFSIENSFDKTLETTSTGIGLINLKRRLSLLYPNKHELKFTQKNNRYKATLKISI